MVKRRSPAIGTEPLGYSPAAGSVEENNRTGVRTRAIHLGQYSMVNQLNFGWMLSPHRGLRASSNAPSHRREIFLGRFESLSDTFDIALASSWAVAFANSVARVLRVGFVCVAATEFHPLRLVV